MENFNDTVETELLSQITKDSSGSCCYKRPNGFVNESLSKESRTFPDHGGSTILDQASCQNNSKNSSHLSRKSFGSETEEKLTHLLDYEDAPLHLQFNPYILRGYRSILPTKVCLRSVFWWTNETVNIWSHIFGWFLFAALTIYDIQFLSEFNTTVTDNIIIFSLLACFQVCMLLSSIYHIFSCRSAKDYDLFLTYDLFGIALSLLAIYISGVYYAFWCHETLRNFYTLTVAAIFAMAMVIQVPRLNVSPNTKLLVFVAWAAYGFIPTLHWTIEMGGFHHPMVKLLVPRIMVMYLITGIAFLFYITKIPERWFVGKVDFCGHSHNWWHLFVLAALYYWHNTGFILLHYLIEHGCIIEKEKCYFL